MKVLRLVFLLPLALLQAADPTAPGPSASLTTNAFTITGMHCKGCAEGLRTELRLTPGITYAEVQFTNRLATLAYDTNRLTPKQVIAVIREAGFEAKLVKRR